MNNNGQPSDLELIADTVLVALPFVALALLIRAGWRMAREFLEFTRLLQRDRRRHRAR